MTQEIFGNLLLTGKLPLSEDGKKLADRFVRETEACRDTQEQARAHIHGLKACKSKALKHAHTAIALADMLYDEFKDDPAVRAAIDAAIAEAAKPAEAPIVEPPAPVAEATPAALKRVPSTKRARSG